MSSPAVAINFNGPAQKKSKGRVENIPRTKDQAARTHDLAPRAQDTEASPRHGTQCSGGNCGQGPSIFCPHREGGTPFLGPPVCATRCILLVALKMFEIFSFEVQGPRTEATPLSHREPRTLFPPKFFRCIVSFAPSPRTSDHGSQLPFRVRQLPCSP
jgi:hypothetical protein